MVISGRGTARPVTGARRLEWLAVILAGALALLLWQLLDSAWPWLLALGVLLLAALVGVRRPGALPAGLAAADVWWLLSVLWWGWCLVAGASLLVVALWWAWTLYRARPALRVPRVACPLSGPLSRSSVCLPRARRSRPRRSPESHPVPACPDGADARCAAGTRSPPARSACCC
jgi:hypothetical protein